MKIAIFGASGATGQLLTSRCLDAGHDVAALVRKPDNFRFANRVRLVTGSVFDPGCVRETLAGSDAVLSALGARSLRKEDVLERAVPIIVQAMRESGVRRIVVLGGASAHPESLRLQPALVRWFLLHVVYRGVLKWPSVAQRSQWETLSTSDLDWTMVMPPMLTNSPAGGSYRVDTAALPPRGARISRADLADFMVRQLTDSRYLRKGVYIAW